MSDWIRPHRIRLEASSLCQLRCPSCPNASGAIVPTIGKGYLKKEDFTVLLDRSPFVKEIELSNYGEIFLNPDLIAIMREAWRRGVVLRADNGVNLNCISEEQLDGLVRYGVRSITCSLDGATAQTYQRYRINGHLDQVLAHIGTLNRLKKKYNSRYPVLTWQFIVFGHNQHEIVQARTLAAKLGMQFQLKLSWDIDFSPVRNPGPIRREAGFSSRAEYRNKRGLDPGHRICNMLWEQPQINWDGRILGCSRNFWGEFGGNAFADGLLRSANSPGIRSARKMLIGAKESDRSVPCSACQIYFDRVATQKYINRGLAMRFIRWSYREMKTYPVVRSIRTHMARRGL
jgi:MoaA/NifB/PqqE/SkfB family radical SAM enzyme